METNHESEIEPLRIDVKTESSAKQTYRRKRCRSFQEIRESPTTTKSKIVI